MRRRRGLPPWPVERRVAERCPKGLHYTDFADLISRRGRPHVNEPRARGHHQVSALGLAPHQLRPAAADAAGAVPRKALAEAGFPSLVQDVANA
jgi:hypothetical protein